MTKRFSQSSLGQQLALIAAGLCLLVGLALVALGAISSRHMHAQLQDEYGNALAQLIARRVSGAMENGDLLGVTASLQHFVNISAADMAVLTDIDGKRLGQAGEAAGTIRHRYSAPVRIESDIAGQIDISIPADSAREAQTRLILSLLGLALLLSLAVYGGSRHFGQRLGRRLTRMARAVSLEDTAPGARPANELEHLEQRIEALPMDLLRTRSEPRPRDEHYRTTAVLYLHLDSLAKYVDKLDEQSLQRYTRRLHQVVYAAAGFYAGDIHVARQFGLAVYFSGDNKAGSAAFRAACCAWLVAAVCRELEKQMSRSISTTMAISQSELGVGDDGDIYPGLYMQHTLDELQAICATSPAGLLLSPAACEDMDVSSRLRHRPLEAGNYAVIEEFAGTYRDLLERQLRLVLRRLSDPTLLR
ncbi:MAG: hypothetical protein R3228_09320 [Halioglobus sp.]|nr:hypothetical protein [Halioglobus sp.]